MGLSSGGTELWSFDKVQVVITKIWELSCGVYIKDQPPSMNFTPDVISDLAAFNATLDIDIILVKRIR